jgi:hypothetical protein
MMKIKLRYILVLISLILLPSFAYSQTARITDLVDLNGGTWAGESGQINLEDDICIFSSSGNYTVTASGSGAANRFRVANGAEFMNYTVRWNNVSGTTSGQVQLTKDVVSATLATTETVSDDCSGGATPTAHIQVRFGNGQLRKNLPGSYTGTLTLVITSI